MSSGREVVDSGFRLFALKKHWKCHSPRPQWDLPAKILIFSYTVQMAEDLTEKPPGQYFTTFSIQCLSLSVTGNNKFNRIGLRDALGNMLSAKNKLFNGTIRSVTRYD